MKLTLSKLKVNGLHHWVVVGRSGSSDAHDGAAEQGKTQTATKTSHSLTVGDIPLLAEH